MIGLALIALGTGGIKPCVAAFGGDQFKLPEQERQLQVPFKCMLPNYAYLCQVKPSNTAKHIMGLIYNLISNRLISYIIF